MKKTCFKCLKKKDISEFYKHGQMADGYLNKCKECAKKDVHKHRKNNIEKIRAYDRKRSKFPHRIKAVTVNTKKYRTNNPIRYAAHTLLSNAIRNKKIKKLPCEVCGKTNKIHGHHEDYYKPLSVIWLCAKHHSELHKEKRNNERN